MAERVLRGIVAVSVTAAVARHLGTEEFGVLSYALSFVMLFSTLWTLGLSSLVVRELVREPQAQTEILGTLFALRLAGGGLGVVAIIGASLVFGLDDPTTRIAIAVLAVATLFYAFDGIDFWLQSRVMSRFEVMARGTALLVTAAVNIGLIVADAPVIAFAIAAGSEWVLAAVGLAIVYTGLGESILAWRPRMARARSLLSASWPLVLSGAFYAVNLRIDQLMLGGMAGTSAVGTYAAAARLSEVWYFVPTAIATSVFPALLRARAQSAARYEQRQQQLYDLMAMIALPLAVVISVGSPLIIGLVYGSDYSASAPVLAIHVWAGPFVFMAAILSKWLVAEDHLRFSLVRHGAGAASNVVLNLLLIPPMGPRGSAVATLISYAVASHLACFVYPPTRQAAIRMTKALAAPLRYPVRLFRATARV